jgi:hypothetical protein
LAPTMASSGSGFLPGIAKAPKLVLRLNTTLAQL